MLSSVSNINFRGETIPPASIDLNAPGKFSAQTQPLPEDSFEKNSAEPGKKSRGLGGVIAAGVVALAAFAGLGYAVKSGHLGKVEIPTEGMFAKAWAHVKNAAATVGEWAGKCWDTVAGWFGKKGAEKAAEAAE